MLLWIEIVLVLLLLAFFVMAETAFFSSNKLLFELEIRRQHLISRVLSVFFANPGRFVFTMRICYAFLLVTFVWLFSQALVPLFSSFLSEPWQIILLDVVCTVFLLLLVPEYLAKLLVAINPNGLLSFCAIPLYLFYILLFPLTELVTFVSKVFLRLFGVKGQTYVTLMGTEGADGFLQQNRYEATEGNELETEVKLIQNAMDFSNVKVRDCMVPRTEVIAVEKKTDINELIDSFVDTGKSKVIVYEDDIDNAVGYIHSSELFTQPADWTKCIHPLLFVPENMPAKQLMKNMLAEKMSMAVIVDEFGGTSGIVTLEDLVEEIFGEIEDEHDTQAYICKQINEKEFLLSGRMEIDQVNEQFNLSLPESEDYMTVAGLILHHYRNFPKLNEVVSVEQYDFKIVKMTQTKIELVRMKLRDY